MKLIATALPQHAHQRGKADLVGSFCHWDLQHFDPKVLTLTMLIGEDRTIQIRRDRNPSASARHDGRAEIHLKAWVHH